MKSYSKIKHFYFYGLNEEDSMFLNLFTLLSFLPSFKTLLYYCHIKSRNYLLLIIILWSFLIVFNKISSTIYYFLTFSKLFDQYVIFSSYFLIFSINFILWWSIYDSNNSKQLWGYESKEKNDG